MRSSGRTPFEELTMSKFQSPLLNFGEAVLAQGSGAQEGKLGSSWDLGIWLRRSTRTHEHLVGTRTGVIKARIVKRRLETFKWDRELYPHLDAKRVQKGVLESNVVEDRTITPRMFGETSRFP